MADYLKQFTQDEEDKLARKIRAVYRQAATDVKAKLRAFNAAKKEKAAAYRAQVKTGEIDKADYQAWLQGQVFQGKQWQQKVDDITRVYMEADEKARELLGGTEKNVFAEAANYTAFDLEKGTKGAVAFNIYDKHSVERLLKDNPQTLPKWKINEQKDYTWNARRVRNAVAQGIIQGESIDQIGARLTTDLSAQNANKMTMFARTAVTGAQNAGRIDRLHEAEDMGIQVKKKWLATLDSRTRDAHADLDGQEVGVDEKFKVNVNGKMMEIDYPGDPLAPPELVYNCRCTLTYVYPKYNTGTAQRRVQEEDRVEGYQTYKQWKEGKQPETSQEEPQRTVEPTQGNRKTSPVDRVEFDGGDELLEKERNAKEGAERRRQELDAEYSALNRERRQVNRELSDLVGDDSEAAQVRRAELEKRLEEIKKRREDIGEEYSKLSSFANGYGGNYTATNLVNRAESTGVEYRLPVKYETPLQDNEIVKRLGGGDMTEGSCASVGLCYVGQQEGYDVLDFRNGESRKMFSQDAYKLVQGIATETGYPILAVPGGVGTQPVIDLVKQCEAGKEYYLIAGRHAAVVRTGEDGMFEYLELQCAEGANGWKKAPIGYDGKQDLDTFFQFRFGCEEFEGDNPIMLDTEGMKGSKLFHRALGYINTAEGSQAKGDYGFAK